MIILIRKRHLGALALFLVFLGGMATILWNGSAAGLAVSGHTSLPQNSMYIIDAGHGGEDGGAVAADGTVESGINLAVALRLNDLLRFCGQTSVMTRSSDISIYSEGAKTLHEKKVSDLKNRVSLVNSCEGSALVSIHQNTMPSATSVHGAQVFYNTVDGGQELAKRIQATLNTSINVGNEKVCKRIPSSIYLMKNVSAPAVLVECGFLSNAAETIRLCQGAYQLRLAAAVTSGILSPNAA